MSRLTQSYCHRGGETPLLGATIPEHFAGIVSAHAEREAVVSLPQRRRLSYAQLALAVDRLARGLLGLGFGKGDRIGIWSTNNIEWLQLQLATARIGAVLVNINPAYRAHELEYSLKRSEVQGLFLIPSFRSSDYVTMLCELIPELTSGGTEINSATLPMLRRVVLYDAAGAEATARPHPGFTVWHEVLVAGEGVSPQQLDAVTAGLLVGRNAGMASDTNHEKQISESSEAPACCASNPVIEVKTESSCCTGSPEPATCCSVEAETPERKQADWLSGIRYAFTDLLGGILFWLCIGLLFSAAVATWLPSDFLARWGSGLPAMLVMISVSIPMYVCATASTPIAAGLLLAGISPGTVLVFLLAGPASNIGSMGIIRRELGQRALLAYLAGVTITAIASGLLLDWFLEANEISIRSELAASEHLVPHWLAWISLLILVMASLNLLRSKRPQAQVRTHVADQ